MKNRWAFAGLIIAVVWAVSFSTSCSSCAAAMIQGRKAGEAATAKFHSDWNNSDWDSIIAYCDPAMFENTPEPKLRKFFAAVHAKLGNQQSAKEGVWRSNATTSGTYFLVNFDTQFEKGSGTESFTWKLYGDQAKLVGWHINSNALLDPSLTE
jgi:hypothetical protein